MSRIAITKVAEPEAKPLPVFEELGKRLDGIRQRAFELFENRGREFGHALDDWLRAERELGAWPAAELKESGGGYELSITLPGFEPKDIELTATPSELIVHAAVKHSKKSESGDVVWTEFGSNDVYRRFELPTMIDAGKITASLDKGILRVTAPAAAKPEVPAPEPKALAAKAAA